MLDGTGVYVTPHMLRHTFATQLLDAGCKVTSIQALLGHRRLNSTMIYAKAHDETVAKDYFTAMQSIETKLENIFPAPVETEQTPTLPPNDSHLQHLLTQLQADPLTDNQQQLLVQLQQEILQMMNDNEVSKKVLHDPITSFFVNEQPVSVE